MSDVPKIPDGAIDIGEGHAIKFVNYKGERVVSQFECNRGEAPNGECE